MKNLIYRSLIVAGALLLAFGVSSCSDDDATTIVHKAAVQTLTPDTDESGTKQIFEGDAMTASGVNLQEVSKVLFNDVEAKVINANVKAMEIVVPMFDFAQRDLPHLTVVKVYWGDELVFTKDVYVTVPVSDVIIGSVTLPDGATVGGEVTVVGRNLDKVKSIKVGDVTLTKDKFTNVEGGKITLLIPEGVYTPGANTLDVKVYWGDNNTEIVVPTTLDIITPAPATPDPQVGEAVIGDEIAFTGEFLNIVDSILFKISETETCKVTPIPGVDGTSMSIKIPSSISETVPAIITTDIVAYFGDPAQTVVIFPGFKLDTTPSAVAPTTPTMTSIVPEDGGAANDKFYLKKKVTLNGADLDNIESIKVGGFEATIEAGRNDAQLVFTVPEDFAFTTATDQPLKVYFNGGEEVDFGVMKVYPFYFWPDRILGVGSASVKQHTDFVSNNSFFIFDTGEVISAQRWLDDEVDPPAKSGVNANMEANTLNKAITKEDFYAIKAYTFFNSSSGFELSLTAPSNSATQLKNHRAPNGASYTSVAGSVFGTPIIAYRTMSTETEKTNWADKVIDGSLDNLDYAGTFAGGGAPKFALVETSSAFAVGSVLLVQYATHTKGGRPAAATDIRKQGFIHIKEVTCVGAGTVLVDNWDGHVKFDCYWSKVITED